MMIRLLRTIRHYDLPHVLAGSGTDWIGEAEIGAWELRAGCNSFITTAHVRKLRRGQAEALEGSNRVVLDMDSSESPVHGEREGSAYNGRSESV